MIIAPMRPDAIRTDMGEYVLSVRGVQADAGMVSLDVKRGQIVALIGSGAANALATIAGRGHAKNASVRYLGYEVARRSTDRLAREGLVLATGNTPFAGMTVLETVTVGALVRTRSVAKATLAAREVLELLELSAVAERYGNQLDPRDARRLALARAVASTPILLLAADMCAGPPAERAISASVARAIAARGTTLVLGETSAADVEGIVDAIVEIARGATR